MQRAGFVRHGSGEIVAFADVCRGVVELDVSVLEELDQLEVAVADGAGRCGPPGAELGVGLQVAGEVPVQRLAVQ